MGSCQSVPNNDLPPPATEPREPQPYSSDTPIREEVAPRSSPTTVTDDNLNKSKPKKKKNKKKGVEQPVEKEDGDNKPPEGPRTSGSNSSGSSSNKPKKPSSASSSTSPATKNHPTSPTNKASNNRYDDDDVEEQFRDCDNSRWKLVEHQFNGSVQFKEVGKQEVVEGQSIEQGIATFKANPAKYTAMIYQTSMLTKNWPAASCMYTLVHRKETVSYVAKGIDPAGQQTILLYEYQRLPPLPDNILPKKHRDKYTDTMTHHGKLLHTPQRLPILPGRGMGVGDTPNLKIIGDVDPSDIHQGAVRVVLLVLIFGEV